ncbi:hypothetical protein [Streptomyces sp. SGAir0957]
MADTSRTNTDLLVELGQLRALIADKIATTPVRLGPGGTDRLANELTLAVAVYVGRHVLPADALALANPPRPAETQWVVETRWNDGPWRPYGAPWPDREEARSDFHETVHAAGGRMRQRSREYRLVRRSTTYAVEAEHTPEQQDEPKTSWTPGPVGLARAAEIAHRPPAQEQRAEPENPRAVCTCGHTRGEHVTVSGRLLCDVCDPDSTDNLVCKEFEEL